MQFTVQATAHCGPYLKHVLDMLHGFLALDFVTLDCDESGGSLGNEMRLQGRHCRWVCVHKPYLLQHLTALCRKRVGALPMSAFKTCSATSGS